MELTSPSGLRAAFDERGTLLGLMHGDIAVNLFVGSALEGGPTHLVLRRHADVIQSTPLLGPRSPTRWRLDPAARELEGAGEWQGLRYRVAFRLAAAAPAWFWHVDVENTAAETVRVDLLYLQDLALAPYAAVRMNEYYVSQYVDHAPLEHPRTARCSRRARTRRSADAIRGAYRFAEPRRRVTRPTRCRCTACRAAPVDWRQR